MATNTPTLSSPRYRILQVLVWGSTPVVVANSVDIVTYHP